MKFEKILQQVLIWLFTGFLHSSKTDYFTLWIGSNTRKDGSGFGWSDGSPFVFYNWFPGNF